MLQSNAKYFKQGRFDGFLCETFTRSEKKADWELMGRGVSHHGYGMWAIW